MSSLAQFNVFTSPPTWHVCTPRTWLHGFQRRLLMLLVLLLLLVCCGWGCDCGCGCGGGEVVLVLLLLLAFFK